MQINGEESRQILKNILRNLYLKTSSPHIDFPIKVIDSPETIKSIVMNYDTFVKNYDFFEGLSRGRLSSNGEEWKQRASMTQSFFLRAHTLVDGPVIEAIYRKHFLIYLNTPKANLYETFVDAALEVMSQVLGIDHPIPWPRALINAMREGLMDLQAMSWVNADQSLIKASHGELQSIFSELLSLWRNDPDVVNLLNTFAAPGKSIPQFDPAGELAQILLAGTETVASNLLWVVECMTRHTNIHAALVQDDAFNYFVNEVLRLFPPIPFVTRVCLKDTEINGVRFAKNETLILSILGAHCDPQYWSEPLLFKARREEFVTDSYARLAYIPFLSGPRVCAGMKLAKQEIKYGMRALLNIFDIKACHEERFIEFGISSRPGLRLEPYLTPRFLESST